MSTRCHPCFATPVLGRLRAAFRAADAAGSAPLLFLPEVQTYFDQLYLFRRSVRLIVFVNFAIIGMALRVPGANDLAQYWKNLCEGVDTM